MTETATNRAKGRHCPPLTYRAKEGDRKLASGTELVHWPEVWSSRPFGIFAVQV